MKKKAQNETAAAAETAEGDGRNVPKLVNIESINLRLREADAQGGGNARRWHAGRESTITCYSYDKVDAEDRPMRVFRAAEGSNYWPPGGQDESTPEKTDRDPRMAALPPYWPQLQPILIWVQKSDQNHVRFGEDVANHERSRYRYVGWLPLGLIAHTDADSLHHACTIGDHWVGSRRPAIGPTETALTPAQCRDELQSRSASAFWTRLPPANWPEHQADRLRRLQDEMERLAHSATTLAGSLRARQHQIKHPNHGEPVAESGALGQELADLIDVLSKSRLIRTA